MLFGSHVSAAGGVEHAPERAAIVGCEVFQFFSRPPQGGPAPKLTAAQAEAFKANCKKFKQAESYIHTPYYINFASTTPRIRYGSIAVVREELERGTLLGCKYVMTHLGSTKAAGRKLGFHKTWRAIQRVLDGYKGACQLLLEISSGAGDLVGSTFEELRDLIKHVESTAKYKNKLGVCLDSCHMFAAGYDLRTKAAVKKTLNEFGHSVGFKYLKLMHVNDSQSELGGKLDRHEHLGKGKIGLEGFRALVQDKRLDQINFILETPKDSPQDDLPNLELLKKFRQD
jgi:deoxyribonuclease-4